MKADPCDGPAPTEPVRFMSTEEDVTFEYVIEVAGFGKPDVLEASFRRTLDRVLGDAFPNVRVKKVRRAARQS